LGLGRLVGLLVDLVGLLVGLVVPPPPLPVDVGLVGSPPEEEVEVA